MGWIRERKLKDGTTRFYPIIEEIGAPGWHGGAFNKRRDAERALAKAEADKAKGISLPTATNKRTTFDELVKRWLGSLDQTRRNFKNQRAHMIFWCNHLGRYAITSITPSIIASVRLELANQVSNPTVNRYMATLSGFFRTCQSEWHIIQSNPCKDIRRAREGRGRNRVLSKDEIEKLLKGCQASPEPHLLAFVYICLATGFRFSEVATLTWDQVELNEGRIILPTSKNNEPRTAVIDGKALSALKVHAKVRAIDTDLVFPTKKMKAGDVPRHTAIRRAFDKVTKELGLHDVGFHTLRHTFATICASNGANLFELGVLMGHKSMVTTKRYAHLTQKHAEDVGRSIMKKVLG